MNVFESLPIPPSLTMAILVASLGTLMLLTALGGHVALGRRRARARSAVWNACALGLVALPVGLGLLPGTGSRESKPLEMAPPMVETVSVEPVENVVSVAASVVERRAEVMEERIEPASRSISWLAVSGWVYLVVTAWLLSRLVVGLVAVERLRRRARGVESGSWVEALEHWRGRLGLSGAVRLAATDRVSVPVVIGWWRPTVLVPEGLVKGASRATIDAVLLHELAHVRRGDYFWNVLWKLAQAVYWPQPLVWAGDRLASSTRERACDALCVGWLEDGETYRNTLIELAEGLVNRPPVALGMTMARTSRLGRRLADMEGSEGADSCRASASARWVLGVVFLSVAVGGGLLKSGSAPVLAAPVMVQEDGKPKPSEPADENGAVDEPVKMVGKYRIVKPRKSVVSHTTHQPGTAQAGVTVGLYAKHSGVIKTLNVDIGDRVKAGDVLAEIETPELKADVERAKTALEQAQARLEQVQATVAKARIDVKGEKAKMERDQAEQEHSDAEVGYRKAELNRFTALARKAAVDKKLVEDQRQRYSSALASAKAAKAGVLQAEVGVEQAEAELLVVEASERVAQADAEATVADLEQARAHLEWSRIKAPIGGIVTQRNINLGEYVRAAEDAAKPAFTVVNADMIRVSVKVFESDVPDLDVGDPATVHLDALPRTAFKGKVSRVANVVDPETRSMLCEIDLPNPEGKIRPGMYGAVAIVLDEKMASITIPFSAIDVFTHNFCYRMVDGQAVKTRIQTGLSGPSKGGLRIEVLDGLDPGDLVIENPDDRVKDGEPLPGDEAEVARPDGGLGP